MKIGLIGLNSQFVHSNLALYYLRENAPNFCQCTIKEYTVNDPILSVFYDITAEHWDVLALSVYIWNKETVAKLLPLLKAVCPETTIILGGPEPTYAPEDFPLADYIVYGALENTWEDLLVCLSKKEKPNFPGVNGAPQFSQNWKFPYVENDLKQLKNRLVYYETSRGCPYHCGFCLSSAEKSTGFLPMERVKKELLFFLAAKIPVVKLVDRTFNYPTARAKEIMKFLMENCNGVTTFHLELKGELIDEEMLKLFRDAPQNLFQVEIGIQTLNDDALKASKRKNHWEKTKAVYKTMGALPNLHTHFDLIAGLPYEDYASFKNSFNEAMSIFPSHMQLGFLKLLPGTKFQAEGDEHGYIAQEYPPYEVVENQYISHGELGELKKIDKFLDQYYNKEIYKNLFRFAMDYCPLPLFDLFHSLAVSEKEPVLALQELFPEKSTLWETLGRFDTFLGGRKIQVTQGEEKAVREFLKDEERVKTLLPHYQDFPVREIYKRIRIGHFPFKLLVENGLLVGFESGISEILFDYKSKGQKRINSNFTDFMLL
ncbi:MAG: DUF4080 domain-containing protein [Clostridiales bacterium]